MSFSRFRTILLLLLSGVAAATCGMAVASGTGGGIDVQVTVGTDLAPDACAATTSLDVLVGDKVNFCYRVTNNSATPLAYQSLDDSVDGAILSEENLVIAPGATVQYNRIRVVAGGQGGERTTTWTARDARPDYTPSPRAGAFIDIASRPTVMDLDPASNGSDPTGAGMTPVDVPFSFPFYGVMANQLCVGVDASRRSASIAASCSRWRARRCRRPEWARRSCRSGTISPARNRSATRIASRSGARCMPTRSARRRTGSSSSSGSIFAMSKVVRTRIARRSS